MWLDCFLGHMKFVWSIWVESHFCGFEVAKALEKQLSLQQQLASAEHRCEVSLKERRRSIQENGCTWSVTVNLLGQWLNCKLFGITYLVGKIKFKLFFSGSIG